ncbi:MAG: peptidylprolyl isomerase [Xanthomonadales bacterium]|nr:peptidylprolyl isomerase [Xanthomonadales bacterium]
MIHSRLLSIVPRLAALACALGACLAAHADERLPDSTVVASRGGATVTLRDVDASLQRVPASQRGDMMNSPKRIEELVSQLLLTRQLSNEGKAAGLERDPLVQHALELARENALGGLAVIHYRSTVDIGDVAQLAKERFDADPAAYAIPEDVVVQHILIDMQHRSDNEALTLATRVLERATKGEDFDALVMEFSDDPSKATNKGVIEQASSGRMDQHFASASGALRTPGEFAPLTKSQFGYHVIKLVSRSEPRQRAWSEISAGVIDDTRTRMIEARVKDHVDQLRGMALDANPDAVSSLRTRYAAAPVAPSGSGPTNAK